jgi:GDP-D-mannose dehydratase
MSNIAFITGITRQDGFYLADFLLEKRVSCIPFPDYTLLGAYI